MRAVDGIDIAFEVAPRRWVQAVVFVLCGWMYFSGNYTPINWYIQQKTEQIVEIMMSAIPFHAVAPSDPVTVSDPSGSTLVTAR